MSKESFKLFVKKNPELLNYINKNNVSFQKLYEIYDIYGEDNKIWNNYLKSNDTLSLGDTSLKEVFNVLKNLDLNSVQKGVENLQKAVNLFQDIASVKDKNKNISNYQRRPIYKYFED